MFRNKNIVAIFVLLVGCTLMRAVQFDGDKKYYDNDSLAIFEKVPDENFTTTTIVTATTTPEPTLNSSTATIDTVVPGATASKETYEKPTPALEGQPDPEIGSWISSCIKLKMAAQLNFTYAIKDNVTKQVVYKIPKEAVVGYSLCGKMNQLIELNWGPANRKQSFALSFFKAGGSYSVSMIEVVLILGNDTYPNAKDKAIPFIHRGTDDLKTPNKRSYHCTRAQTFILLETSTALNVLGALKMHDVQLEAFRKNNSSDFSTPHDCDSSESTDIAPFAVGIALTLLALIVLVAYLCARQRVLSRGYMSF